MDKDRRGFLKRATITGAAALATTLAGRTKSEATTTNLPGYPDQFGVLVDTAVCIGCRRCEWACKEWNKLPGQREIREYEKDQTVFERNRRTDANTYTVVNRFKNPNNPSKPIYIKKQCMHCYEPACANACFVKAYAKKPQGAVVYDTSVCVGCRYCLAVCPFEIPAYQYDDPWTPEVTKCTFCFDRISSGDRIPACVAICPVQALTFGKRSDLIELAHKKIIDNRSKYVNHVYGEHEVGGTSWLYLSSMPFNQFGFRTDLGTAPVPTFGKGFLSLISPMYILLPALCMGLYTFSKRRDKPPKEELAEAIEEEKK